MAYDEDLAHRVRAQLAEQDATHDALARPHTRVFDMTGRPMKGWILVGPDGAKTSRQLGAWLRRGVQFAGSVPPKG